MTTRAPRRFAVAPLLLLAALPATARAQRAESAAHGCEATPVADEAHDGDDARAWPAPLDRPVGLRAGSVSLEEALERLADASRVRFSYSPELLPLDRRACLPAGPLPLGDALRTVLAGTGLVPVVAGRDQVVLAPGRISVGADAAPELARSVGRLQRVVVTGTATGGPERASPFALDVIEGAALQRGGTRTVAQLLDGTVPGLWMWAQQPTSVQARYGSVRGASSFTVTAPKVYIDGIELADPLLLSQVDGSRVQRIEVIRGPQGAALYGADAMSGVINIVTRHDGATAGEPRAELRASAGTAGTAFAPQRAITQEHGLQLRGGVAGRSAALAASVTTVGAYVPGASARHVLLSSSARRVGSRLAVAGTARYQAAATDTPASPLLDSTTSALVGAGRQRLHQYGAGATATFQASERWTNVVIAGIDGYHRRGLSTDALPIAAVADPSIWDARRNAQRLTMRANATRRISHDTMHSTALIVGLEQSVTREHTNGVGVLVGPPSDYPVARTDWWGSTGALVQGQVSIRDQVFVQGGTRLEYVSSLTNESQVALLPMAGAAWVRDYGRASLKLRGAYGRGIRPLRSPDGGPPSGLALLPEQQSGIEWGADLRWDAPAGARVALQATRFDQLASNLAQPVVVLPTDPTCYGYGGRVACRPYYELQNVGAIGNDGWEVQASAARGSLVLASSLALVDSRIRNLDRNYRGDLRVGDRMLGVPARTIGVTATWSAPRWSLSGTVARASDWRSYDQAALAVASAEADAAAKPTPSGAQLRAFHRTYPGVTRVGARMEVTLWRATSLTLRGDNLLDRQTGEPDNVTVLPGRTVVLGLRTGF